MTNIILTSFGRIMELPVSIKDVRSGESIVATNAPGGRLYTSRDENNIYQLNDLSLVENEDDVAGEVLCLPLIDDYQSNSTQDDRSFAEKLKIVDEMEKKYNKE